jgi:DNA invertase Pin-like site-specific DNA recombinase
MTTYRYRPRARRCYPGRHADQQEGPASVAQYETEVRGERIKAGISANHARGEKWGNGRPKGSAHKATPEVVKQVQRTAAEGAKKAAIARVCKLSRQTVYSILTTRSRPGIRAGAVRPAVI